MRGGGVGGGLGGPRALAVQEVEAVGRRPNATEHDRRSRGALVRRRRGGGDGRVRAVGGDEVDERLGVLYVQQVVVPAPVRLEVVVAAVIVELGARRVQGRNAGIAAARDVEGRQVERQAEQIVTHG